MDFVNEFKRSFDGPNLIEPTAAYVQKLDAGQRGQLTAKVKAFLTEHQQDLFSYPLDQPTKQALLNLKNNFNVLYQNIPDSEGQAVLEICKKALNLTNENAVDYKENPLDQKSKFEKQVALLTKLSPPSQRDPKIISALVNHVPLAERDDCFEKISNLAAPLSAQPDIAYACALVLIIGSPEQRGLFLDEFENLLKNKNNLERLEKILGDGIGDISPDPIEAMRLITILVQKTDITGSKDIVKILKKLKPLTAGQVIDLIQKTAPFMRGITQQDSFTTVLNLVRKIYEQEDIIKEVSSLISHDFAEVDEISKLLEILVSLPTEERKDLVNKTLQLTQNNFPVKIVLIVLSLLKGKDPSERSILGDRIGQALGEIRKMSPEAMEVDSFNWLDLFFKDKNYDRLDEAANQWIDKNHLLQAIILVHNPALRVKLTEKVVSSALKQDIRTHFTKLQADSKPKKIPLHLLLANLQAQGLSDEAVGSMKRHLSQEAYNDNVRIKVLIGAFLQLIDHAALPVAVKSKIVTHLSKQAPIEAVRQAQRLQAILKFNGIIELRNAGETFDFDKILKELFEETVTVSDIPDFSTKYAEIFENYRDPLAIPTYTAQLNSLHGYDGGWVQRENEKFLRAVLTGNYPAARYQTEENRHLKFLEEQGWGKLLNNWQLNVPPESLKSPLNSFKAPKAPDFKIFLTDRIMSNPNFPQDKTPMLHAFLETSDVSQQNKIQVELGKQLSEKKIDPKEKELLNLQSYCIKLAQGKDPKGPLKALKNLLGTDFLSSLEEIERQYDQFTEASMTDQRYKDYQIVITDNAEDLLMSGTEVMGSCQDINGDPNINKCLLAYVMDGKNRLIAIKDKDGKIVARTIIRLLWAPDAKPPTPVLYQEPLYTDGTVNPQFQEAIRAAVKKEAERLGIPLRSADPVLESYPHALKSFGSPLPFEYSDTGGYVTSGGFTIPQVQFYKLWHGV